MAPTPLTSAFAVFLSIFSAWVARDVHPPPAVPEPCECQCYSSCEVPLRTLGFSLVFFVFGFLSALVAVLLATRCRARRVAPAAPLADLVIAENESPSVLGGKGRVPSRRGGGVVVRA